MADQPDQAADESSIGPVSSLRSRFENLGQDTTSAQSRPTPQKPQLYPPGGGISRSVSPVRTSLEQLPFRRNSAIPSPGGDAQPIPRSPTRRPASPKSRPLSLVSTPRRSPPLVTVDSPRSPAMLADQATPAKPSLINPSTPAASNSASPASSIRHVRTPSRTTTPALEARMSLFLQASQSSENTNKTDKPSSPVDEKSKGQHPAPPPVNRAGKPKIPSGQIQEPEKVNTANLVPDARPKTPEQDRISPFSTPPSSSNAASHESLPPPIHEHLKPRISSRPDQGYFSLPTAPVFIPERRKEQPSRFLSRSPTVPIHYQSSRERQESFDGDAPDDRPGLPPRHELQTRSGRTSPIRSPRIPARRSEDLPRRAATIVANTTSQFMPPPKRVQPSALTQGFDRTRSSASTTVSPPSTKPAPPAIPPPRRSVETRRDFSFTPDPVPAKPMIPASNGQPRADDYEDGPIIPNGTAVPAMSDYPDSTQTNRRPPQYPYRPWQIPTGYDTRLFAVSGEYVCTTGYVTRVWSIKTGETLLTLPQEDNVKCTAIAFKPAHDIVDEGKRLWLGTNIGEIQEVDIPSQRVVFTKSNAHPRREIIKLYRHASQLWSLDDEGKLHVWSAGSDEMPSLESIPQSFRVPRGHTFSIATGGLLWYATQKDIRVFQPSAATETSFQVLQRPLSQPNAGDVTSGAIMSSRPDLIYFGHADGKVSIYNKRDFTCQGVISVSVYKISSLAGVGDYLWAGYNTGMAYVYDTSVTPWRVKKDWLAHDHPICGIIADPSSIWKLDRYQVVSLGLDNMIRIWDGLLQEDWMEEQMQQHDEEYCSFQEMSAAVLTWNAGAAKPNFLRADERDNNFFREYLTSSDSPDIFVFGFQELVDLEDKKVTAKSFFKSKKKDPEQPEHMSHQYRAWRDHLTRCLEDFMPHDQPYSLLHTASMVGLFTCVFVKTSIRSRIKQIHGAEVKRGMGGLHGNKGALILRLVLDDSSICLVNCHLAAGQTQTVNRNNDIAAILEAECLPVSSNPETFVGGGDGSMILDHEICILNGDLNYRIDAMSRDSVVRAVRDNNLTKLLQRDQLLLSRKKHPGFRLRAFQELPITFAPTYKYNVGTDEYDTSEKKRAPAWCDRLLYRGLGRIKCDEYRRWEVRVSDHRPVSGRFRIRVKKMDEAKRRACREQRERDFESFRGRIADEVKLDYLINVFGLPKKEALRLLKA